MIRELRRVLITAGLLAVLAGPTVAQDDVNDAADVWATIEGEWDASQKRDHDRVDDYLAEKFMGWGKNSPAPRSKTSTRLWSEFNASQGRTLEHELYPLSIVVHENVAVAHYLYTMATKDADDKVDISNGRYTDVLIRTDDGWKFLSWHGGDDD